jgi:hypothetical protein
MMLFARPRRRHRAPGALVDATRTRVRVIDAEFSPGKKICMTGGFGARDVAETLAGKRIRIGDSVLRRGASEAPCKSRGRRRCGLESEHRQYRTGATARYGASRSW